MTDRPGFSTAQLPTAAKNDADTASLSSLRQNAEVLNSVLRGKLNAVLTIKLTAGVASTTIKDSRISPFSALILQPLTTHAAAVQYAAPYVLPTNQKNGEVTFTHANDANADKDFNLVIIG